jgi:hypothetical protein
MPKRRITQHEKWTILSDKMAVEGPRRSDHMVIVSVEKESDEDGNPIVTVLRMRQREKSTSKEKTEQKRK